MLFGWEAPKRACKCTAANSESSLLSTVTTRELKFQKNSDLSQAGQDYDMFNKQLRADFLVKKDTIQFYDPRVLERWSNKPSFILRQNYL